jgi:glycosyltransferase involved in cell wall biosynthesis
MSTLVSIIIPAKGDLKFFPQTLQSIEDSIYCNFEVVLIDDGISPEKINWITEYFKAKQGYKIVHNSGVGIVDALNTGITNSTGTYIARLDTDDCIRPDRLGTQVDFLQMNPQIGVVGSQITYINHVGEPIGVSQYPSGYVFNSPRSFKSCLIAHPAVMIRREVLEEVGGYSSLLKYKGYDFAEDFFLWLRISRVSQLFNLQEPLTLYRQHDNQISNFKIETTLLAAILVYIKSIDPKNNISTPIQLEQLTDRDKKLLYALCLKNSNVLLLLLLNLKLLETKDLNKSLSQFIKLFSRLLSRVMGFNSLRN